MMHRNLWHVRVEWYEEMSMEKVLWRGFGEAGGWFRPHQRFQKNIPVVYKYLSCARCGMIEYTIHMGMKSNLHALYCSC